MVRVLIRLAWFPSVTKFNADGGRVRFSTMTQKSRHSQERIWEHDLQWKDQEEPQGSVDERNVQRPCLDFRGMINQNNDVAVYQDQHQCTEEDGGHQEPLHDLESGGSQKSTDGWLCRSDIVPKQRPRAP